MLFVALLVIWVFDSVAFDCCDCGFFAVGFGLVWVGFLLLCTWICYLVDCVI